MKNLYWLLLVPVLGCHPEPVPLAPEVYCSDELDQDEDGDIDCSDADCRESVHCRQDAWQPEPRAVYEGPVRPFHPDDVGYPQTPYRHHFPVRTRPLRAPDGTGHWLHIHDPGTEYFGGIQLLFTPPFDESDSLKLSRARLAWTQGDLNSGNFQTGDYDCDGRLDLAYLDYEHQFFNTPFVGWDPHCPIEDHRLRYAASDPTRPWVECSILYLWFGSPERDWLQLDLVTPDAWLYDLTDAGYRDIGDAPRGWDADILVSADFDGDACDDLFYKRTIGNETTNPKALSDQPSFVLFGEPALRELRGIRDAGVYSGLIGRPAPSQGSEATSMEGVADLDQDGYDDVLLVDADGPGPFIGDLGESIFGSSDSAYDPTPTWDLRTSLLCAGRPRWQGLQVREETCRPLVDPSGEWLVSSAAWLAVDATGDGVLDLVGAYVHYDDMYEVRRGTSADWNGELDTNGLNQRFPNERYEHPTANGVLLLYEGPIDPHGNAPLLATALGWHGPVKESANHTTLAPGSGRPGEPVFWVATGWDLPLMDTIADPDFTEINPTYRPARTRFYGIERLDPNDTRPLEFAASVWFGEKVAGDTSGVILDALPLAFSDLDGALVVGAPYATNAELRQVGRVELYKFSELLGPH